MFMVIYKTAVALDVIHVKFMSLKNFMIRICYEIKHTNVGPGLGEHVLVIYMTLL